MDQARLEFCHTGEHSVRIRGERYYRPLDADPVYGGMWHVDTRKASRPAEGGRGRSEESAAATGSRGLAWGLRSEMGHASSQRGVRFLPAAAAAQMQARSPPRGRSIGADHSGGLPGQRQEQSRDGRAGGAGKAGGSLECWTREGRRHCPLSFSFSGSWKLELKAPSLWAQQVWPGTS